MRQSTKHAICVTSGFVCIGISALFTWVRPQQQHSSDFYLRTSRLDRAVIAAKEGWGAGIITGLVGYGLAYAVLAFIPTTGRVQAKDRPSEAENTQRTATKPAASLHDALRKTNPQLLRDVLGDGCDLHAPDSSGQWPLHLAALNGDPDVISMLLEAGADLDPTNPDGWTPLHCAVRRGHVDAVRLLLTAGADQSIRDAHSRTPLDIAKAEGLKDVERVFSGSTDR